MARQALPECGEHQGACARCGVEIKSKGSRKRYVGEARRKRKTISIKVPADTEDGGALWDERMEAIREKLIALDLYDEADHIPVYEALMAATYDWLLSLSATPIVDRLAIFDQTWG